MSKKLKKFSKIISSVEQFDKLIRWPVVTAFDKKPDLTIEVTLDNNWEMKSTKQLRYLHGIVLRLMIEPLHEAGLIELPELEYAKRWLKFEMQYFDIKTITKNGIPYTAIEWKSFEDAKKDEMVNIIEFALRKAAEMDLIIPDPKDFNLTKEYNV